MSVYTGGNGPSKRQFPRLVHPEGIEGGLELVGFWDGGEPASAGCVYAQCKH